MIHFNSRCAELIGNDLTIHHCALDIPHDNIPYQPTRLRRNRKPRSQSTPETRPKSHQSSPVRKPGIPNHIFRHLKSDLIDMLGSQLIEWLSPYGHIAEPLQRIADRILIIIAILLLQALVRRVFKPCPPTTPGNPATHPRRSHGSTLSVQRQIARIAASTAPPMESLECRKLGAGCCALNATFPNEFTERLMGTSGPICTVAWAPISGSRMLSTSSTRHHRL
jgi:hypothetical protein